MNQQLNGHRWQWIACLKSTVCSHCNVVRFSYTPVRCKFGAK